MTSTRLGLLAVVCAAAVIWAIPAASAGKSLDLRQTGAALKQATNGVVTKVETNVNKTVTKTNQALRRAAAKARSTAKKSKTTQRAVASDPKTQPPMHGTDPHGQGGVAIVDTNPSNQRPLGSLPNGSDSEEDAIVGRARGEKTNGAYHGHITILALLGSELAGVDSKPGESKTGPLDGIQKGVLDPLCQSTNGSVCLSVLTANSTTSANKSENDFAVARASVLGLGVGAAESKGAITEDSKCQVAAGSSRTANVASSSGAIAQVANSTSSSQSCTGAAPVVKNSSQVIGLGGAQVPLPAPGCADGTPDTVTGIPAILPIVCNAEDIAGAAGVREALDVYVLQVGGTSLAKETTAASESFSVAPPAGPTTEATKKQCSDGVDNDGDGVIDARDPGCHSDGNARNAASYDPDDDDETDRRRTAGSGRDDTPQCSDGVDNDGDGRIDGRDGGCHTDGNPNNPDSYDPSDDDESGGATGGTAGTGGSGGAGDGTAADTLPFTGTDLVGLTMAGLLLLAGGLLLRRREGTHAPQ